MSIVDRKFCSQFSIIFMTLFVSFMMISKAAVVLQLQRQPTLALSRFAFCLKTGNSLL